MPVDVVSINFLDEDFGTISTGIDYLNGSIGDKLTAEIIFDVHWETPVDTPMNVTTIGVDKINRYDGGSFISDGFKNGDDILVSIGANVLVPVTILGTFPLYLNVSAGLGAEAAVDGIVYGVTPVQNLDYYYGIVENSTPNPTISLIDGSIQKLKSETIIHTNTTPSPILPATTVNSWVYDLTDQTSTIEGLGALIDVNRQRFKIIHKFYIQPVFKTGQIVNGVLNSSTVPYLANVNSLKYVPKIDCRYATGGTAVDKSTSNGNISQYIKTGDVAWFDEIGNGNPAEYSLSYPISYINSFDASVVGSILPNTDTDISINLSSLNSKFSQFGTSFIINVYRTPNDATTYQNTTTDIKENFLVSRLKVTTGGAGNPAEGFIKAGATATYISADEAIIDFTFEPTFFTSQDQVLNDLQAFNQNPSDVADGYLIFVTCQDKAITNKGLSDKVAVLCDVNVAEGLDLDDFYNTTDVCITNTLFNDHPTNDSVLAFTDYNGWVEDSVVTKSRIQVLKTNENQTIDGNTIQNIWNLNNVILKVEAEHKTDLTRFFTLEESQIFLPTVPVTQTRTFVLPIASPQNEIVWAEDTGAETGTHKFYDLQYPFKIRWEDWVTLFGVDNDFAAGNQDWVQYINADWNIKVNLYKEMDLAQDLGVPSCGITFTVSKSQIKINILTNTFTATWNDPNYSITNTTNSLDYFAGFNVQRPLEFSIQDCNDVTSFEAITNAGFVGSLDLSIFTSLDSAKIHVQSGPTDLILPASGGSNINVSGNSFQTADLTGFTNLTGLTFASNGATSVSLPTLAAGSTLPLVILNSNNLITLDLTTILPAMFNGAKIYANNNALPISEVDQILIDVDATGYTGGVLNIKQNPPAIPTGGVGNANIVSLQGNGWVVIFDV